MANIVEFNLFLAKSYHECPGVELEVLLVDTGRQDIVVVQVLTLLVLGILSRVLRGSVASFVVCRPLTLPLASCAGASLVVSIVDGSSMGALSVRHLCVENRVRLRVVQLLALLVVHACPQEVYALVEQIDVTE